MILKYIFNSFVGLLTICGVIWINSPLYGQDLSTDTLAQYTARLHTIQSEIDGASAQNSALKAAQNQLKTVLTVTLPSGVAISIHPLLAEIDDPAIALQRIETVLRQIELAATDRTEERLAQLQAILDRRPINPLAQLWDQFLRWLRDFLRQFGGNSPVSDALLAPSQTVGWVILVLGGVIIALLLGYWLQGILGNMIADRRLRIGNGEDGFPQTAAEARQAAQQLAQVGNYREAVRRMYLAALLGLDENGLIRYDRSLTNREVLTQTTSEVAIQAHLRPVVDTFDAVWYGIHEPDEQTYTGYVSEIDRLEALVKKEE